MAAKRTATWTTIDSKKAQKILEGNKSNRPMSKGLVKRYAQEMLSGDWSEPTGESIIIDSKGHLQNGQHRLHAVILAEEMREKKPEEYGKKIITHDFVIVRGINPKAADNIDIGKARNAGDVFFRHTELFKDYKPAERKTLTKALAGAARLVYLRVRGLRVKGGPRVSHAELYDFIKEHPELPGWCEWVWDKDRESREDGIGKRITLPYAAGLCYLAATSKTDGLEAKTWDYSLSDKVEAFVQSFADGVNLGKGHPILVGRAVLRTRKMGDGTLDRDETCTIFVKCLTAFLEGKKTVKPSDLKVKFTKGPEGERVAEFARLGGIDIEIQPEEEPEETSEETPEGEE